MKITRKTKYGDYVTYENMSEYLGGTILEGCGCGGFIVFIIIGLLASCAILGFGPDLLMRFLDWLFG
ncbi:MAG: hypothetical protein IJJ94_01495 [Bacteroidaceae bacterium]|nr:hypothetical protein [Bacteroidaceae bacterium]